MMTRRMAISNCLAAIGSILVGGWNAATLFGCRRARPLAHLGGAGLLWAVSCGRLVELHLCSGLPIAAEVREP